jgi:hypothetical protein
MLVSLLSILANREKSRWWPFVFISMIAHHAVFSLHNASNTNNQTPLLQQRATQWGDGEKERGQLVLMWGWRKRMKRQKTIGFAQAADTNNIHKCPSPLGSPSHHLSSLCSLSAVSPPWSTCSRDIHWSTPHVILVKQCFSTDVASLLAG